MTAAPVLARTLKYKVSVTNGANAGQSYAFDKPVMRIGRGPENDLVFSNDPKMSRMHAEIRLHMGQLIIRNVSQKNYILVNGEKVEEKTITGMGLVQIGETLLQIQVEQDPGAKTSSAVPVANSHLAAVPNPIANPTAKPSAKPVGKPVTNAMTKSSAQPSPTPQVQKQAPPQAYMPPPPSSHSQQAYQSAPPSPSPRAAAGGNSRLKLYGIVVVVAALGWWLLDDSGAKKKPEVGIRTEGDVARAIEDSAKAVQELRKQQEASGQDSIQYKSAQEHYIKGFRDYRQGQYARAMQSFQAALSFYPAHQLARKYLIQSQRKFEEQIDRHMSQGRKYYQRQNYKMCQSSFASVMIMVKDSTKPKYREAKQFMDECQLRLEGGM